MAGEAEIALTSDNAASEAPKEARRAPSDRGAVSSFRLSAVAREQLAQLAEKRGVSQSRMVEELVEQALDDPDGFHLRLASRNSLIAAAASLTLVSLVSQPLALALSQSLASKAELILGPLPPRPADLQGEPAEGAVADFVACLESLGKDARHGE